MVDLALSKSINYFYFLFFHYEIQTTWGTPRPVSFLALHSPPLSTSEIYIYKRLFLGWGLRRQIAHMEHWLLLQVQLLFHSGMITRHIKLSVAGFAFLSPRGYLETSIASFHTFSVIISVFLTYLFILSCIHSHTRICRTSNTFQALGLMLKM